MHLECLAPKAAWDGKIVELSPEIPDDSAQAGNLGQFRDELTRIDFKADQTGFSPMLSGRG